MSNIVTLGVYQITFQGKTCVDNLQTWTYTVVQLAPSPPGQEISHWILGLCPDPPHQVIAFTGPDGSTVEIGGGNPCLPDQDRTIRWEDLSNANVEGEYTFTLLGCFEETQVPVAVKVGRGNGSCINPAEGDPATITGPSCDQIIIPEPPGTGGVRGVKQA